MERCHLYLPLVDSSGAPYSYAEVTLLDEETGQPTEEPVYLKPRNGGPETFPILFDPSVINLWTDNPIRVTVQASLPGGASLTRAGVDIGPAPLDTVRTTAPLRFGSAAGLDGSAVLSVSPDGSAAWQVLDILRFHRHTGDAPQSTVLGPADLTDIYPGQTWIGASAGAAPEDQAPDVVALGQSAHAEGAQAVALGNATAGPDALAAGVGAAAGPGSVALGGATAAPGEDQTVVGRAATASASVQDAIAVGSEKAATTGVVAILQDALRELSSGTLAVGPGTVPDLAPYGESPAVVLLGDQVVAPWYVGVRGDTQLGDATTDTVGFYGATGGARPTVNIAGITSGTPGRAALQSLISALIQLNLISTTG